MAFNPGLFYPAYCLDVPSHHEKAADAWIKKHSGESLDETCVAHAKSAYLVYLAFRDGLMSEEQIQSVREGPVTVSLANTRPLNGAYYKRQAFKVLRDCGADLKALGFAYPGKAGRVLNKGEVERSEGVPVKEIEVL